MVKVKIFMGIILLLLVAVFSSAQQSEKLSVQAGTIPGNLFYGLDRAAESIQLAMTRDHIKKAELHLEHAEERLAEMNQMIEKNKFKHVEKLAKEQEDALTDAEAEIAKAEANGEKNDQIAHDVAAATYKHILLLTQVLDKVPEQAKESIQHALNASVSGHQKALMKIESQIGKPEDVPKAKPQEAQDAEREKVREQETKAMTPEHAN
jgi:hypothetical protein